MLTVLVLVIVAVLVLGALTRGVRSTTKGVDALTGKVKQADAWLQRKIDEQRAAKKE